jgi:small subunit ribosomal protein S16
MVRIRLRRVGRKKQPSYRLVAADKESPRDGRFIEILGFYNPRTEPATIKVKEDRVYYWLSQGAQFSDGAEKVCRSVGLIERYERFKAGEDIETLLKEAADVQEARNVSPRTRHDAPKKKAKAKAPVEEKAEEPAAESVVEEKTEEPVAEAEEAAEEKAEEPAVEAEEVAEEKAEEPAVEAEEVAEEKAEEPVAEAEEVAEEDTEEPAAEAEEAAEEEAEEPAAETEEAAEEKVEEPAESTEESDEE